MTQPNAPHRYREHAPQRAAGELFVRSITQVVLEALAGIRRVEQLARFFDEDAFMLLANRAALAQRARLARGLRPQHPPHEIGTVHTCTPSTDAVEATIVLPGAQRTRAAAIRIELFAGQWRVTSFTIL